MFRALATFVVVAAAAFVFAAPAAAHDGAASITCTSVTFSYTGFADAENIVSESILIGISGTVSTFTFSGSSGSHTVGISVPQDGESYTVTASASWDTNEHQGSFSTSAELVCGEKPPVVQPPVERCIPGEGPYRGKDGKPGNTECCPDKNENQVCDDEEVSPTVKPPLVIGSPVVTPPVVAPPVTPPDTKAPAVKVPDTVTPETKSAKKTTPKPRPRPKEATPVEATTSETLPYTGLPLGLVALLGTALVGIGAALWRKS